jgi:thiol-disulfide isomerase/thioredoxin
MKFLLTIIMGLLIVFEANTQSLNTLTSGRWVGCLRLTDTDNLYFEFLLEEDKNVHQLIVLNGEERVPLNDPFIDNDSIHIFFKNFNTKLVFKPINKQLIEGEWVNYLKPNYSIPFYATLSNETIFPREKEGEGASVNFSGKWKAIFSPEDKPYDAIGIFEENGNRVTGTFLTETGDYRFLSGNKYGSTMYLSGFDGSHAFLFIAKQGQDGKIDGKFLSGTHHQSTWTAERNQDFELQNFDSLTKVVGDHEFTLNLHDLDGNSFAYKNKVVIVQVLGTWCANCMDETVYMKELYEKYHDEGLEIISVGYETGNGFDDYVKNLKAYRKRFDLKHEVVVGGSAKKLSVKEDFSFLSDFTSFPTTLFIDRNGRITRIHTGFSGPSTVKYYLNYK